MPPLVEKKISSNLTVAWGFPDGHAEVIYRPSLIGKFTCRLEPEELLVARGCVMLAIEHALRVGKLLEGASSFHAGPPPEGGPA